MSSSCAHHFSDRNIPFGIASSTSHPSPAAVTRIFDTIIFLDVLAKENVFGDVTDISNSVFDQSTLNELAALPKSVHQAIRQKVQDVLRARGVSGLPVTSRARIEEVTMHMPVEVHDFTDFSCSLFHVQNAGRIINKSDRLPPAFKHFPIGYQGRTASIVISGTSIERPQGCLRAESMAAQQQEVPIVTYSFSQKMDYEAELAAVVGKPLAMQRQLSVPEALDHVFGFILLNDWSARDIQSFEMSPLGPLNGKSMGTSISPWIVTTAALDPFRTRAPLQSLGEPAHLEDIDRSTMDITLEVSIVSGSYLTTVGVCPVRSLYWTPQQMIVHSVSSGSALRTGDLLATGTVSGETNGSYGCLLEATNDGQLPIQLADGSERQYLHDGDTVHIMGYAGDPSSGVGFGECVGRLVHSLSKVTKDQ